MDHQTSGTGDVSERRHSSLGGAPGSGGKPYRTLGECFPGGVPSGCALKNTWWMKKVVGEGTDRGEPAAGVGSASRAVNSSRWLEPGGDAARGEPGARW